MKTNPRGYIQTIPMLRFAILFSLGIVLGDALAHAVGIREWIICLCATTAMVIIGQKKSDMLCNVAITIGIVLLGTLRISINEESNTDEISENQNNIWEEYTAGSEDCYMVVLSEPIVRGKVIQFDGLAKGAENIDDEKIRVSLLRDTITKRYEKVHVGSVLRCKADLSPLKDWHRDNKNFDYVRWLRTRGFVCRAFIPIGKWEMSDDGACDIGISNKILLTLTSLREKLIKELSACGMAKNSFGVATAMTLGNRAGLTPALRDEYSIAGASHILALSGMHLSIIYMILSLLIGKRSRWASIATIGLIWTYVLFVGMPISVVRAACMLTIWEIARGLGRVQDPLNIVGLTILIIVGVSPQSVWDVGFQMSIAAVSSIIIFADRLNKYMPETIQKQSKKIEKSKTLLRRVRNNVLRSMWYTVTISLAAQIGTLPLVVYYFGRIPFYFIFTNFIVIPCAPIIVCGTLLLSLFVIVSVNTGGMLQPMVKIASEVLSGIVAIQNTMLEHIAALPGSSIEGIEINAIQVLALYTIIICIAIIVTKSSSANRQTC